MIWLGGERGYLSDWTTQRWVELSGQSVDLAESPWLIGPTCAVTGVGPRYFEDLAAAEGLRLETSVPNQGILPSFDALRGPGFDPAQIHPDVVRFYEQAGGHELDVWSAWSGVFRPFGWLLAVIFSRRLQQLNVPLSPLDTSRGMSNEVIWLVNPTDGSIAHTAWLRRSPKTERIVYAGFYSACMIPGCPRPCVKVVFPLPNGNAVVFMETACGEDGALVLTSAGKRFGDAGFYFTVHGKGDRVSARYVTALRETIRVYGDAPDAPRADHTFRYFGAPFMRIHYRMRWQPRPGD